MRVRMLNTAAIPLVVCMGATFIILMGSIDLSVEGTIALCAVAASMLVANDLTGIAIGLWSVPAAILLGGALGLLNGVVHVKLKIPSFMATLGIGFAGIGIATAILGGVMVRIADNDFRNWLSLGRFLGIPAAVWIAGARRLRRLGHPGAHAHRPLALCHRHGRADGAQFRHPRRAHPHPDLRHRRPVLWTWQAHSPPHRSAAATR